MNEVAKRAPFDQLPFDEVPGVPRLPHPYFSAESRRVKIESAHFGDPTIHVTVFGEGPPLVLVHGLMTTSYSFRYVLEPLGKRFTVYVPDLVGAGRSDKPRARYTPDAVADSIGATMKALGIWGAPVIGNSMGGYLAMRLALRSPDAISRLVNLHSPGVPTARMHALAAAFAIIPRTSSVIGWLVKRNPHKWVHRNVHYFDETLKSREEHEQYASALLSEGGIEAFASHLHDTLSAKEMARFASDVSALSSFPIPLLLVYAKRDPMVPPSVGEKLAKIVRGSRIEWLEEGSHFAHVDAPSAFLAHAVPFLAAEPAERAIAKA